MNKRETAIEWIKSYLRKGNQKEALRVWSDHGGISVDVYRKLFNQFGREIKSQEKK